MFTTHAIVRFGRDLNPAYVGDRPADAVLDRLIDAMGLVE